MKRVFVIFIGVCMLITMFGMLFFSGAIYDAEKKYTVDTFFFEPNDKSSDRVMPPVAVNDMTEKFLRGKIISRFIHEYFYVIPDIKNAEARAEFMNTDGTPNILWFNSVPSVSDKWAKTVAPEIVELAGKGVLRTVWVDVDNITKSESGHLVVKYELRTWTQPNNVLALPEVTKGSLYLDVSKNPIRVEQTEEALQRLQDGYDPITVFNFGILGLEQN